MPVRWMKACQRSTSARIVAMNASDAPPTAMTPSLGQAVAHFRALQHGVEFGVHALHDLVGNALGADHAVPQIEVERRIALLAVGRDVGRAAMLAWLMASRRTWPFLM